MDGEKAFDDAQTDPSLEGHAYHYNLPSHYVDKKDGIPLVTKYADRKAKAAVKMAYSIQLSHDLFIEGTADDNEMDCHGDGIHDEGKEKNTWTTFLQKCNRLSSLLSTLQELKHGGISQLDLSQILIHIVKLLSATIVYSTKEGRKSVAIHYDDIGYLYDTTANKIIFNDPNNSELKEDGSVAIESEEYLDEKFALPTAARESLLGVVITLVTSDDLLRAVSNTSFRTPDEEFDEPYCGELLIVLEWKAMLRMLLRTAPYLDEKKAGSVQMDSLSRQSSVLKRTVLIIRYLRKFYDQGLEVKDNVLTDRTARELWEMVASDLTAQTHSNASYRALILLYLFHPSRSSREFYTEMLPKWLESWTSIDRCPDYDFLWLTMFCRARKYVEEEDYDWGPIRTRLLTLCGYWLQIPVGGKSSDKSFPNAAQAKSRRIPARLKSFIGNGSSYQEGVEFVSKVSKLLIFCLGKQSIPKESEIAQKGKEAENRDGDLSDGTEDVLRFLAFVAPYFHPSNTGAWTFPLGVLLHYISYELCRTFARGASQTALMKKYPLLCTKVGEVEPYKRSSLLPACELILIMDALLPLCQQTLYSKSARVARAGESALLYLTQIDHKICPLFLDFAMRALDVSSVNLSHQAPAALSALSRLVPPSLKTNPVFFLERLPEMLRLTLAGIDCNDQDKTIRTLIFYRTVTSWLPIGEAASPNGSSSSDREEKGSWIYGKEIPESIADLSESDEYWTALRKLPKSSLLYQAETSYETSHDEEKERMSNLLEEAAYALGDWSVSFLERIYDIFRAAGEQEKVGKSHGIASRHSSADASQAKHFNLLLQQCLNQVFAAMDGTRFESAARSVEIFLRNEALPLASKYASILCEAVCATRIKGDCGDHSPGLDILLPCLSQGLATKSNATILYRVRSLAGAVRRAGPSLLKYQVELNSVLQYTLKQDDKKIFKAGCKLLRHLLSSQCESYPISSDNCARFSEHNALGKPSQLRNDHVRWHIPTGQQLNFATEIFKVVALQRIKKLSVQEDGKDANQAVDLPQWRRSLKIVRYALRGAIVILQEVDAELEHSRELHPHEIAYAELAHAGSEETSKFMFTVRGTLTHFIGALLALIANGSESAVDGDASESQKRSPENIIASDVKLCNEAIEISTLLSTRRGAPTDCQGAKALWKLQKGLAIDRVLSIARKELSTVLRKSGHKKSPSTILYNDGEDGGKSFPRRMLTSRVYIFLQAVQRDSSFEIPRRLRRKTQHVPKFPKHFNFDTRFDDIRILIESSFDVEHGFASFCTKTNLPNYEALIDGSFSLACHTNAQIRTSGYRLVENLFSRFGWFASDRVERLLSSLMLSDEGRKGEYGLLSCADLSFDSSVSNKRRLAEVLKGVSNLLHLGKVVKDLVPSEQYRLSLVKALCRSQRVISLLPVEEIQKMTHYFNGIFSKFRSRYFTIPRLGGANVILRREYLEFIVGEFNDEGNNDDESGDLTSAHWRDRLISGWFLLIFIDQEDMKHHDDFSTKIWNTCFACIQEEAGQPIQKLSLGLFGRLCSLFENVSGHSSIPLLQNKICDENFCNDLCKALVYNHKEDKSIDGGHGAQWSVGVESMLRDAQSNIAPRIVFPFKRMGRSSGTVILQHMQLLSTMLNLVAEESIILSAQCFLMQAKQLASAAPSEDQRNELCTSAEIFGGIAHGLLSAASTDAEIVNMWTSTLLPCFGELMDKIPSSALAAYSDALRFIIQNLNPFQQGPLREKIIQKIEDTLWKRGSKEDSDSTVASDGFAEQSKWVGVMCAILIELDSTDGSSRSFSRATKEPITTTDKEHHSLEYFWSEISTRLLPRLLDAIGHPYQKCREQIAWCLFCICNCHAKLLQQTRWNSCTLSDSSLPKPGYRILEVFIGLDNLSESSSKEQQLCLTTARFFVFYCLHYGDNKNEYADFILPLLPMAFEAIKLSEGQEEVDSDVRMLQAQVVKGYRHSIAEISASCFVTYNNEEDITKVLKSLDIVSHHDTWQVRHTAAHFLRCFQGCHKFLFTSNQTKKITRIISKLLADDRKEVSSAAMSALTGVLASTPTKKVEAMVDKYVKKANNSIIKKKEMKTELTGEALEREFKRAIKQQTSVYFLGASVLSRPYETPDYVPKALATLSKHSYERSAPFTVRETVKFCCREYKRTHMTDNWELHKQQFTEDQLDAFSNVVSTPHYYA